MARTSSSSLVCDSSPVLRLLSVSAFSPHQFVSLSEVRRRRQCFDTDVPPRLLCMRSCFPVHPRGSAISSLKTGGKTPSPWSEKPYSVLSGGVSYYLDVLDVSSFLGSTTDWVPINPNSYNPAAYLWKKIGDIPEERRNELLELLGPRHIKRAWEISGLRYFDADLSKKCSSAILTFSSNNGVSHSLENWTCKKSGGPALISWVTHFKMALFPHRDGSMFGRFFGVHGFGEILSSWYPLYFKANEVDRVMASEEPCDAAFELQDGVFDLGDPPATFPCPAKHPAILDDEIVVYVRHAGPGLMVGEVWREWKDLDKIPSKFCGEILMVKNHVNPMQTIQVKQEYVS